MQGPASRKETPPVGKRASAIGILLAISFFGTLLSLGLVGLPPILDPTGAAGPLRQEVEGQAVHVPAPNSAFPVQTQISTAPPSPLGSPFAPPVPTPESSQSNEGPDGDGGPADGAGDRTEVESQEPPSTDAGVEEPTPKPVPEGEAEITGEEPVEISAESGEGSDEKGKPEKDKKPEKQESEKPQKDKPQKGTPEKPEKDKPEKPEKDKPEKPEKDKPEKPPKND
jgi:hypothetical protein